MYCPHCGSKNNSDSKFCKLCGKLILTSATTNVNNLEYSETISQNRDMGQVGMEMINNFPNKSHLNDLKSTDCYERAMKIVPDSIIADDGEVPVKQYNISILRSRLKFARAEGRLQVTNKRVLFRATGRSIMGRTTLQHEFAINEIAGLEVRKDHRFGLFEFFIGGAVISILTNIVLSILTYFMEKESTGFSIFLAIILGMFGWASMVFLSDKLFLRSVLSGIGTTSFSLLYIITKDPFANGFVHFLGFISGICALISLITFVISFFKYCFVPNLVIDIQTKGGRAPIQIRRKKSGLFQNSPSKEEYTGFSEVIPAEDTDQAIKEIGALISDVQKLGDLGIEKWVKNK